MVEDVDYLVHQSDPLVMVWALPVVPAEDSTVMLGVLGESLTFEHDGEVVDSLNASQHGGLRFRDSGDGWEMFVFDRTAEFLPVGESTYSFEIYDMAGDLLVSDEGTVTVSG
jgi:hypothetical protein